MNFIKQNHVDAQPYHSIIDDEIRRKYIDLVNLTFAAQDHARLREVFERVAWRDRDFKMWIKCLVAALPYAMAGLLNRALQKHIGGKVADASTFTR